MPGATFKLPLAYVAFGVVVADGVMNAVGPNTYLLSSATAAFKETDVGKRLKVEGAGAGGVDLDTFIARQISATQVELKSPALTTVAGSDISYTIGRYRLSDLMSLGDIDGNKYSIMALRRLSLQVNSGSPGGVFLGGPYVSPTNVGVELTGAGSSDNTTIGDRAISNTAEYICTDTANALLNVYWQDDINQSTPA